jgi:hypothetical protein
MGLAFFHAIKEKMDENNIMTDVLMLLHFMFPDDTAFLSFESNKIVSESL